MSYTNWGTTNILNLQNKNIRLETTSSVIENSQNGETENYANDPYYAQWSGYDPNYPPHPYWNNPYWNYYDPNQCYSPNPTNQNGETEEANYQQYWDPYAAYYYNYYNYPYPPIYSPQHFYGQSDTDNEGAGYSSCDEMTYYGAMFPKQPKPEVEPPNIVVTPVQEAKSESESDEESDTDTETEQTENKSGTLLAIKSVSDINVYENGEYTKSEGSEEEEESEDEENDETYSVYDVQEIPHALSVIFEEAEVSEIDSDKVTKKRHDSENTIIDEEQASESSVTVKLPLKFNFSDPVATVTVQPSKEIIENYTEKNPWEQEDKVSYTVNIPRKCSIDEDAESDSEVSVCVSIPLKAVSSTKLEQSGSESGCDSDDESTSSSGDSSSECSSDDEEDKPVETKPRERTDSEKEKLLTLLEKAGMDIQKEEVACVKDKIKMFENIKNEEYKKDKTGEQTDEEDSGVGTSDISRHISETDSSECFPELRKMNKYQRAATHSRLFKLLQDECNSEEPEISISEKKENMTLQLHDDGRSSGINSPSTPTVNDRLVKELVQSLLKRKKGKCFRDLPLEKLHAAALRILQEDMDRCDTISSSEDGSTTCFLSPLPTETVSSSPIQTPQDFSDDYTAYYNTWSEDYDILPSRTFKQLQCQSPTSHKMVARCPRVLSSKNLHKDLQKVAEARETPSPLLESASPVCVDMRTT